MKKILIAISSTLLLAGCNGSATDTANTTANTTASAPESSKEVADFYVNWLKEHGVKNIQRSGNTVVLPDTNVKLEGSTQSNKDGDLTIVEMESRITLADGRTIIDYPAGIGKDEAGAIGDALTNFTLTTFHPLYSTFVDHSDPHTEKQQWKIGSTERTVHIGEPGLRGKILPETKNWILEKYKNSFAEKNLDDKAHWSKLVLAEQDGKIVEFAITVDNDTDQSAQDAMRHEPDWPTQKDFYMVKQFIVIEPLTKQ